MNAFLPGLSFEEYVALDGINVTSLMPMAISPKHYRYNLDHGRPETPSFALGRMAHCALLEPERFERERAGLRESVALYPGPVRRGKAFEEFAAANPGKRIVIQSEYDELLGEASAAIQIRDAVLADPVARRYLGERDSNDMSELSGRWVETESGLVCKVRIDRLTERFLVDLKTSRHALPKPFGRQAAALGYHVRMAFYSDAVKEITDYPRPSVLIVVESAPPYDVTVYPVPDDALDAGRRVYRGLLEKVAECLESGRWPGVAGGREGVLELPQSAYEQGLPDNLVIDGLEVAI